ncbi:MAG: hypothetical protein AAF847_19055 [Bacteroidota bacterium]
MRLLHLKDYLLDMTASTIQAKNVIYLLTFLSLLLFTTCTPKVAEEVVTSEPEPAEKPVEEGLSPCPKFSDAPNQDEVMDNYVLYRDALKVNQLDRAFELWKKVYEVAPAADGKRNTVYSDGIYFYEFFIRQTTDETTKAQYIDAVFEMYDQLETCYPEGGGYVNARRAFDYYYKYTDRKSKEEIYELFKKAIEVDGLKTDDFVINPFTSLLVELYFDEKIDQKEAKKYEQFIREIIPIGLKECKEPYCERWRIVEEYALERLRAFEVVKDFYDCDYYKEQYFNDFLNAKNDCDTVILVFSRLKWGGCPNDDPKMAQVIAVGNDQCAPEPDVNNYGKALKALREARYSEAIEFFRLSVEDTDEAEQKAKRLLLISKVYYAHLRNFPEARKWALRAAGARANWGEPYILIGKLYASSGPLCGSGRGWESQKVVWPAIDMWNKAKSVDPAVASEANRNIANYRQYMPTLEDIFQRGLKEGSSFYIGCWIQENTIIRAAPN